MGSCWPKKREDISLDVVKYKHFSGKTIPVGNEGSCSKFSRDRKLPERFTFKPYV